MNALNNVICKTKYEQAVDLLNSSNPGWTRISSTGNKVEIAKKIPKTIDDTLCSVIPFEHTFISERLKFPLIALDHYQPYFISAQTGAGKTEFIFRTLYPYLHNKGQKLLILVSRTPLKTKVKYDAIDAAGTMQRELLTPFGIEKEHHFGDIDVYSYQDFCFGLNSSKHKQDLLQSQYGAIIFDECQFFMADADFNVSTEHILEYLVKYAIYNRIPRIYMSGTPEFIFDHIYEKEYNLLDRERYYYEMKLYHFKRDYQYLNLMTFDSSNISVAILQHVEKSQNVKWIIFVDSKKTGYELYEKLIQKKKSVLFLSSDSLHSNIKNELQSELLADLVDNERLSCDVLIATKCLDVGISIKDKNINIINLLHDQVDFLQSIGRKRVNGNENVNLLIPAYTESNVNHWLKLANTHYKELLANCELYPLGSIANCSGVPYPVFIENGKYNVNRFALIKARSTIEQLEKLLTQIRTSPLSSTEVITHFFASWMPNCNYFDISPNTADTKELLEIVKCYQTTIMDEFIFKEFCEKLRKFDPRTDQRKDRSELSTQTLNVILKPIGFKIEHNKKRNEHFYQIVPMKERK